MDIYYAVLFLWQGHFRKQVISRLQNPLYLEVRGAFEGTTSSISTNWSCLPILQSLPTQHGAFVKLISAFAFFTLESAKKISRKIWFIIEHSTTLFLYLWECWLQLGAFGLLQLSLVSIFLLQVFGVLCHAFTFENRWNWWGASSRRSKYSPSRGLHGIDC